MVRKCTLTLMLATSLLAARPASAIPVDLDVWLLTAGPSIAGPLTDEFQVAMPLPPTMGEIENSVYFDGTLYTYVHTVNPSLDSNAFLNTAFHVNGYTGTSGWSFSESTAAGGSGAIDFAVFDVGQIGWLSMFGPQLDSWDANEPISFFFVSTKPPGLGDYNLIGLESGTASSYAPVPEPGSIALLGSGLVGLYTALRRRRSLTA
jgi:hypothetical protein